MAKKPKLRSGNYVRGSSGKEIHRCSVCGGRGHQRNHCPNSSEVLCGINPAALSCKKIYSPVMQIKVRVCSRVEQEHVKAVRQYAHTFCDGPQVNGVVCVCESFFFLPIELRLGILAHEVGHLISGYSAREKQADKAAEIFFGVKIKRVNSAIYGNKLESVDFSYWRLVIDRLNIDWVDGIKHDWLPYDGDGEDTQCIGCGIWSFSAKTDSCLPGMFGSCNPCHGLAVDCERCGVVDKCKLDGCLIHEK